MKRQKNSAEYYKKESNQIHWPRELFLNSLIHVGAIISMVWNGIKFSKTDADRALIYIFEKCDIRNQTGGLTGRHYSRKKPINNAQYIYALRHSEKINSEIWYELLGTFHGQHLSSIASITRLTYRGRFIGYRSSRIMQRKVNFRVVVKWSSTTQSIIGKTVNTQEIKEVK